MNRPLEILRQVTRPLPITQEFLEAMAAKVWERSPDDEDLKGTVIVNSSRFALIWFEMPKDSNSKEMLIALHSDTDNHTIFYRGGYYHPVNWELSEIWTIIGEPGKREAKVWASEKVKYLMACRYLIEHMPEQKYVH